MARDYLLVARVASDSDPGRDYEVKTDGTRLTCPCPRWRFARGGVRSCRHVDEVQRMVDRAGGLARVVEMLREGAAPVVEVGRTRAVRRRQAAPQAFPQSGPVWVLAESFNVAEMAARDYGLGRDEWRFVGAERDLQGRRQFSYLPVEGWHRRPDAVEVLARIRAAGAFEVEALASRQHREAGPRVPAAAPEWLGGTRSIILRD